MYRISFDKQIPVEQLVNLYQANDWSSAQKPDLLEEAIRGSHTVVSVWKEGLLVGLGNAISDGALVVYYPHLLVLPSHQGKGIGKLIVNEMAKKYDGFHMQMLTADDKAVEFYNKMQFEIAGQTKPMWKYDGDEH